jgi:TetR/AcrR family transcriptional regulator
MASKQKTGPVGEKRSDSRERLEQEILDAAKPLFAARGFAGVSLDQIAREVGTAKQNLLYYFSSKEVLYRRLLHGVLDVWLSHMEAITQNADNPEIALRRYIAGKLRFSREHPFDSRVYANEVISGAPLFEQEIRDRVLPALQADIAVFNRWAEQGVCRKVDAAHLMVILWSSTQAYADFASQICLVLGKAEMDASDFDAGEQLLVDMVLRTVLIEPR